MAWTNDDARELREFLGKATGVKLLQDAREFSDETLGSGTGFEQVSLNSKQAEGRKDLIRWLATRAAFEESPTASSEYIDLSES